MAQKDYRIKSGLDVTGNTTVGGSLSVGNTLTVSANLVVGSNTFVVDTALSQVSFDKVRLTASADVALGGTTHGWQIGSQGGLNLAADNRTLQARNSGTSSTLYLNRSGGNVDVGNGAFNFDFSSNNVLNMASANNKSIVLNFGDTEDSDIGSLRYNHNTDAFSMVVEGIEVLNANSSTVSINANTVITGNTSFTDEFIVLNSDHSGAATDDAGITINRGSDANVSITWNETDDQWEAGNTEIQGNLVVTGDLTTQGTITFIDTINLQIGDNIITLNADLAANTAPTANAGFEVYRSDGVNGEATKQFLWDEVNDRWYADDALYVNGALTVIGGGSLTGTWTDLGSVTTIDINGGTIDGTVIGGSAAAAGSFTTLNASGLITGNNGALLTGAATANSRLTLTQTTAGLSGLVQQGATGMAISALGVQSLLLETNGVTGITLDASQNTTFTGNVNVNGNGGSSTGALNVLLTSGGSTTHFSYGSTEDNYITRGDSGITRFRSASGGTDFTLSSTGATFAGSAQIGTSLTGWDGDADNLVIGTGTGNNGMTVFSGTTSFGQINWADSNSGAGRFAGVDRYDHSSNARTFLTNGTLALTLDSSQNATFAGNLSVVKASGNSLILSETQDVAGYAIVRLKTPSYNYEWNVNNAGGVVQLYSQTAGQTFQSFDSAGNATFAGNVSVGGTSQGDSFEVHGTGSRRFYVRDDGAVYWNPAAAGGYLSWDTNEARILTNPNAQRLLLRAGAATSLTLDDATNTATFAGKLTVDGGALIDVQNAVDGTSAYGIRLWSNLDSNYGINVASSGALKSLADGTACTSLDGRTGVHIRNRVYNHSTQGFIWENSGEICLMSLTGDTGDLWIKGTFNLANNKAINWKDSGGTLRTGINWNASNELDLYSGTSNAIGLRIDVNGNLLGKGQSSYSTSSATNGLLGVYGSRAGTSLSTIELGGYRTAADAGVLGRVAFHNDQSAKTDKMSAHIDAWSEGSNTNAGRLRFYTTDDSGVDNLNFWIDSNGQLVAARTGGMLRRNVNNDLLYLNGDTAVGSGATLRLYGSAHATNASDIVFTADGITELQYDHSASNWDFRGNSLSGVGNLVVSGDRMYRDVNNDQFIIAGGDGPSDGGNVFFYGSANVSNPGDILFRSSATNVLFYDNSATNWNFQGNSLSGVGTVTLSGSSILRNVKNSGITLGGGDTTTDGGAIQLFGSTEASAAGDIWLTSGGTIRLAWDNSASIWDFQSTNVYGVSTLTMTGDTIARQTNSSQLFISGGTNGSTGANLLLYGSTHATNANDILFRTGTSNRLHWDASVGWWDFQGNILNQVNNMYRGVSTDNMILSGGTGGSNGGNIILYGESNAGAAGDILFRSDSTELLRWDNSVLAWNFGTQIITGVSDMRRGSATGLMYISGGSNLNNGANIQLFGETHATQAYDIIFRQDTNKVLQYDHSISSWDFLSKNITTVGNITVSGTSLVNTDNVSNWTISGGNGTANGSNITLYGGAHVGQANDFAFRADGASVLYYDDSASEWDFQSKDIKTTGDLLANELHVGGITPNGFYKNRLAGSLISNGADVVAAGFVNAVDITGATGDTAWLATYVSGIGVGSSITTQGSSETISQVATMYLSEPGLSVGTGDTVTNACTLYIQSAPTEGTNNYALMVDAGDVRIDSDIELGGAGGPRIISGSGTPEGAVTAPVGSTFHRTDGGAGTSFYVKESGTGNTGWVGK